MTCPTKSDFGSQAMIRNRARTCPPRKAAIGSSTSASGQTDRPGQIALRIVAHHDVVWHDFGKMMDRAVAGRHSIAAQRCGDRIDAVGIARDFSYRGGSGKPERDISRRRARCPRNRCIAFPHAELEVRSRSIRYHAVQPWDGRDGR